MEPLFICEFQPTVKMLANRNRHYSTGLWILIMIVSFGVAAYVAPSSIGVLLFGFDLQWAIFLLISILYPIYGVFFPEITAFFSLRRYKRETDGTGLYRVAFGDSIEITAGKARTILEYRDIVAVVHLKHTYELKQSPKSAVWLDTKGFTKGTFEEFKSFLRTKRPDLAIPE